ncbi:hypothetical protein ACFVHB_29260 [Kitasatospora sp. NPDC127111]|uniref:hypothetical protein n=1 Tax=Kitasatospora sp. NPDC127111 TaxID=3345363 RepID=UPI0036384320
MADDRRGPGGGRDGDGFHGGGLGGTGLRSGAPADRGRGGADGLSTEELLLRELMRRAVAEVQPDPTGLHRIRRAVPRRRAAVRGAWTGAAALVLAVAIALPALHDADHLGLSGDPGSPSAHGGTASVPDDDGTSGTDPRGANQSPHPDPGAPGGTGSPSGPASSSPSPWASTLSTGPGSSAPVPAASTGDGDGTLVPLCSRSDLGQGSALVGTADGEGRIYGYFTVVNTSAHACRLGGPGSVAVTGTTGTDPGRIRVTDHTAGGPATGLPSPGAASAADTTGPGLLLAPRAGYRVDFGWVPDAAGCPANGGAAPSTTAGRGSLAGSGTGSTSGTQAGGPGGSGGAAPAIGPSAAAATGAPPASASPTAGPTGAPSPTATPSTGPSTPAATVTLAHTPAPGSPSAATAVLPGACSGTVYRTAPQPLQAPSAPTASASPSAG